ncbi:MAG: threonine dehydratase [Acidimicrobiaceae bacterium]
MRTVRTPTPDDVLTAREIVARHLQPTPVVPSLALGANVVLKLETLQPTGSFKVRGALVAVARAVERDPSTPIVTASAGNHGLGVAYAATAYGATATIVVPENASTAKLEALATFAVTLLPKGTSYDEAESYAIGLADEGATFVSPYNDPDTIAGQGSVALELFEQVPGLRTIVVPIGGGGLISGVALAASVQPGVRVVGVQAQASPAVRHAVEGRDGPIDVQPTLADGLAGNIESGSVTVDIVRRHVDNIVSVTEDEIADAIRFLATQHGLVVEGSGAVGVAALLHGHIGTGEGPTALLLTGRNIAPTVLARVLSAQDS